MRLENSQWEDIILEKGELIFVDDWKDIAAEEIVIEQTPTNPEEFDSWLDEIIRVIGEVSQATPEQLRKLGAALDTLGKELEDTEEEESVVDMLEADEEEERLAMEVIEEIKKGNKPLMDLLEKLMNTPEEIIETPVKPEESPIANRIMGMAAEQKPEESKHITRRSWEPERQGSFMGDGALTEEEVQQGRRKHRSFLDKILDEIVDCEPMGWEETQKRWEQTWRKMSKEWQQEAMDRRRREQELKSKWNLFYGLTGITPPWSKLNPRKPEPWEPKF